MAGLKNSIRAVVFNTILEGRKMETLEQVKSLSAHQTKKIMDFIRGSWAKRNFKLKRRTSK